MFKQKFRALCLLSTIGVAVPSAMNAAADISVGWNAADYDGNGTWEPTDTNITNAGTMIWTGGASTPTTLAGTNFSAINGFVANPNFRLSTGGSDSWNDILGDPVTDLDATWEFIFRPDDYTSGDYAIFDTGGSGAGTSLRMFNQNLIFRFQSTSANFVEISTDLSAVGVASDFYHVVAVADLQNASSDTALYVNGNLVAGGTGINTSAINDWDGGDTAGLGDGEGTLPGTPSVVNGNYIGDIALMNFYSGQAFNGTQASNAFTAATTITNGTVTAGWNATDYDGDGSWEVSQHDASFAGARDLVWHNGSGTKNTGSTNFSNINDWISDARFNQGLNPTPGSSNQSFQSVWGDNFTKRDLSFETVFRPGDFIGKHILFETGGNGQGVLLQIDGSTLTFLPQDTPSNQVIRSIDLSTIGSASEFFHVV
ncbi:MAG: hypothetical protein AAF085_10845, partial [Planctomycetota bacterium]